MAILIDDQDRYSRLRLIAWWDQEKLASARILVVGAGALGNEVLKNLALLGVGVVYVVDFDEIEESNLTRSVLFRQRDRGRPKAVAAAESLADINPDTKVRPVCGNIITVKSRPIRIPPPIIFGIHHNTACIINAIQLIAQKIVVVHQRLGAAGHIHAVQVVFQVVAADSRTIGAGTTNINAGVTGITDGIVLDSWFGIV